MDGDDLDRYLAAPLVEVDGQTPIDEAALRRRLTAIAADGFVWAYDEYVPGVSSVAVPVFGPGGHCVAAVHVHGPSYRFPAADDAAQVASRVVQAAQRIQRRLGSVETAIAS